MADWKPDARGAGMPFPQANLDHADDAEPTGIFAPDPVPTRERAFERFLALLQERRDVLSGNDLLHLTIAVLGDHATVNDGPQYIYAYARHQGYDIPPYPLAGCGEIKQFFADNGVRNVPEWYGKIGISPETYKVLHEKRLIVVRNTRSQRKAFVVDTMKALPDDEAYRLVDAIISFVLAGTDEVAQDSSVF